MTSCAVIGRGAPGAGLRPAPIDFSGLLNQSSDHTVLNRGRVCLLHLRVLSPLWVTFCSLSCFLYLYSCLCLVVTQRSISFSLFFASYWRFWLSATRNFCHPFPFRLTSFDPFYFASLLVKGRHALIGTTSHCGWIEQEVYLWSSGM